MKDGDLAIDVAVYEPSGAGLGQALLARLGIDARPVQDLARDAPAGRIVVCLENPLATARVRCADEATPIDVALGEWESRHSGLRARTRSHLRLLVHCASLRHDALGEVRRVAAWLGVRASRDLLAAAAGDVVRRIGAQRATAEELLASSGSESLIGLYFDLCAEAGPVYHRALAVEANRERRRVLGPTQRDGHRSEVGVAELMARLQAELTEQSRPEPA